ncbi:MAG: glycosyltransferase family 39 protein [Bacteroidetes bacterium]|nr:glycosyltransferase family 39 protein [Bacteroidota bacterium]
MALSFIKKYIPFFLLALNLCLVLVDFTIRPISIDEPFSIYHAQFDVSQIIRHLLDGNNPPLFEIILHFWIKLFGISPISVRTLPALFACLCPVALYFFGKKNFSFAVGLSSSLLLSFSDLMLFYAHDCRVYSLFVLLTIASFYYFMELLRNPTLMPRILFVAYSVLLIYAHYFGLLVLCIQGFHILLHQRKRFLFFFLHYLIIGMLYAPYIIIVCTRLVATSSGSNWIKAPTNLIDLYYMLWAFSNAPVPTAMGIAAIGAFLIKEVLTKKMLPAKTKLVLAWFFIPFLGMFTVSFFMPMYLPRYLLFSIPAYYLSISIGVESLFATRAYRLIALLAILSAVGFSHHFRTKKDESFLLFLSVFNKAKPDQTLVLVNCGIEDVPLIAYHYNTAFFSFIKSGKAYHQTDSLLKNNNIYVNYTAINDSTRFDTLIYLGYVHKAQDDLPQLKEKYQLQKQTAIGSDFTEILFTKKK